MIDGNDLVKLYGVGISYLEAIALPRTLGKIIRDTYAVMYHAPQDDEDYFCYIFYMDRTDRDMGYDVLRRNFAITSSICYETKVPLGRLLYGGEEDYYD